MFIDSDIFEILILAFIAAMIAYKFYSILGENRGINPDDLVFKNDQKVQPADDQDAQPTFDRSQDKSLVTKQFHETYDLILAQYPKFNLTTFLQGASAAFEMIVKFYTTNDYANLRLLTDEKTYGNFELAMHDRATKKQRLVTTIIKIEPLAIDYLSLYNGHIDIKVKYVSEQTNILYDKSDNIIEGSPNQSEQVTDVWTYRRAINSPDPNWLLIDTGY